MTPAPTEEQRATSAARLSVDIDRHRAALIRYEAALSKMNEEAEGACCATCFYGSQYTDAADRSARCAAHMVRLLRKRGEPFDNQLAKAIELSEWP